MISTHLAEHFQLKSKQQFAARSYHQLLPFSQTGKGEVQILPPPKRMQRLSSLLQSSMLQSVQHTELL